MSLVSTPPFLRVFAQVHSGRWGQREVRRSKLQRCCRGQYWPWWSCTRSQAIGRESDAAGDVDEAGGASNGSYGLEDGGDPEPMNVHCFVWLDAAEEELHEDDWWPRAPKIFFVIFSPCKIFSTKFFFPTITASLRSDFSNGAISLPTSRCGNSSFCPDFLSALNWLSLISHYHQPDILYICSEFA